MVALGAIKQSVPMTGLIPFTGNKIGMLYILKVE
jgi:hypothetical protein